jgi:hypothetical protein
MLESLVSVHDVERHAGEALLAPWVYDYFRSGADEERTLARNTSAFQRFFFTSFE